jgi:hypothetical protein
MIVTGLPDRARGPYRETEMIRVLEGFSRTKLDKYFILPDNCTVKLNHKYTHGKVVQ